MVYYAVAMAVTLLLSRCNTTLYPLNDSVNARGFRNGRIAFLVLLPLTLISILRWDVGVDTLYGYTYWDSYQHAANLNNVRDFEIGFFLFSAILSKLGISFWGYLAINALVFMSCVSYAISRGSVSTTWSILVFFLLFVFFDSFNTLRQTLAESISMIAWAIMGHEQNSLKKDIKILAIFVLASTFHVLALINIPIYLICKWRFNRHNLLRFAAVAVLATPVLQLALSAIMQLVAGDEYTFIGFALINAVMSGVFFLLCWYFYDNICALGTNAYTYVNLALCIFIVILNSGALFLPFRVFDMLKVAYLFIIPYLLRSLVKPGVRVCVQCIILAILAAWFINAFFFQDSVYVPYQTIFDNLFAIVFLS